MKNNNIIINNITEYMNVISKYHLNNYISRGENSKYSNITASAFRSPTPIKFNNTVEKFYNYVGNNLTDMQRKNFLAFSQHHGIPTNLVDFSYSPLVSLFFSCHKNVYSNDESGYVYFINKQKLININSLIENGNSNVLLTMLDFDESSLPLMMHLYEYIHYYTREFVEAIIYWIKLLKCKKEVNLKYNKLYQEVQKLGKISKNNSDKSYFYSEVKNQLDNILKALIYVSDKDDCQLSDYAFNKDDYVLFNLLKKDKLFNDTRYQYLDEIFLLLSIMKCVFFEMIEDVENMLISNFALPFYCTYTPPNIIDRVNNQSSLFIYQLYYDNPLPDLYVEKIEKRITQKITSDYSLEIRNQEFILKELDNLGINLKFIYNDYDNIAKYLSQQDSL